MAVAEVTSAEGCRDALTGYPGRLGISEELRRHRFLQQPDMKKQLDDFSQEITIPKRKRIVKSLANLCAALYSVTMGYLPLQVHLPAIHCPSSLGQTSLSVLYGSLAISASLSPIAFRYFSPKVILLSGIASHLLFIAANTLPSYQTLVPASVISGIGSGLTGQVHAVMLRSLTLRYSVGSSTLPSCTFQAVFLAVYEAAFLLGNSYTSGVLFANRLGGLPPTSGRNVTATPGSLVCLSQTSASWYSTNFNCKPDNVGLESLQPLLMRYFVVVSIGFLWVLFGVMSPDIIYQQVPLPSGAPTHTLSRVVRNTSVALFCGFHGLHQAFVLGDITKLVSSSSGLRFVGLAMSCYGVARLSWILLGCSRWLKQISGTLPFSLLGYIAVMTCYVLTLSLNLHSISVLLAMLYFWGFADGLIEQVIAGMCHEFSRKDHMGIGFTSLRALGMAAGLGYAPFICPLYRLYGLIGTLTLGVLIYITVSVCDSGNSNTRTVDSTDV